MSDDKTQRDRFIEKARELGCDEDPAAFDRLMDQLAKKGAPHEKPSANKDD